MTQGYPCQWASAAVSWISACHFWNCWSLDKLSFKWVGQASFRYGRGVESEPRETPSTLQACSFRVLSWISASWTLLFLPSSFSAYLSMYSTLSNSNASLWSPKYFQKVLCLNLSKALFLLLCQFSINLNTQNTDDLTDHELTVGSFVLAIAFMWSYRKLPEWPQFFQQ